MKRIKTFFSNIKNGISRFFGGKFRLLLSLLFIVFFGLLSLPYISIKINEEVFTLPNLDFSSINPDSTIGNFRKGRDIYPTQSVEAQIDFGLTEISEEDKKSYLENVLNRVNNRLTLSGLYDVDARGEISEGSYYIILSYPEYYQHVVGLTKMLTKKGEIGFIDANQQTINISDRDISSNVEIAYIPTVQSHIKFNVKSEKSIELQTALSQQYFYMTIDGLPEFQVFQIEQSDLLSNTLRGLPIATETQNLAYREIYINITRAYFNEEEPLDFSIVPEEESSMVPAQFANLSTRYVAVLSALVFVALAIVTLIKYKFNKAFAFSLMTLTALVFTVAFLKYISAPISLVFIVAYFVMMAFTVLFIWKFITLKSVRMLKQELKLLRNLGFLLTILSLAVIRFFPNTGRFYDALGVVLIFGISFLLFSVFNFRILTEELIIKSQKDEEL